MSESLVLSGEDFHYLSNVVRAKTGQTIQTFDGKGNVHDWQIASIEKRTVRLARVDSAIVPRKSPVKLTFALNPLKGGNEEFAIRMAAAMEAVSLLPVIFSRSEVPLDDSGLDKRLDRWKKLCISEVALGEGAFLPAIESPIRFEQDDIRGYDRGILFDEEARPGEKDPMFKAGSDVIAFVGPEGGLEREEVALAREKGLLIASLGPWTLRAELAGALVPSWVYSRVEGS